METAAHRQLKRFAVAFLAHHGCQAIACEVRCPISRYRVDVAGYLDSRFVATPRAATSDRASSAAGAAAAIATLPAHRVRQRCEPRTILIECKQSREDFLRDRVELQRLLAERDRLERARVDLEERRIKACEPHLRQSGSALFAELEAWDFTASRLGAYRKVLRDLRKLERELYGQTKFCMIARYRLADRLYIAAPAGLLRPRELPTGWGLLECPRKRMTAPPTLFDHVGPPLLRPVTTAPELNAPRKFQLRTLRNIAVAATRAALELSV